MKNTILLSLLSLFLIGSLQAQNLNFGVKAGAQLINTTHVNDGKNALLYHAGGFVEMPLLDRLHIQAELLFSAEGINDAESDEYKQRNMSLQLPVIAKYQVWDRLSVHAGAQIGMLLSAKMKYNDGDIKESYDNKDEFKNMNFGLVAGAEYLITPNIGVGARINWGLGKVFTDWDKSRQRVYQIFASYRFGSSEF